MRFYTHQLGDDRCDPHTLERVAPNPDEFITVSQALKIVRMSRATLYRLARTGKIPGCRLVSGMWRIHRPSLLQWLACSPRGIASRRASP